MPRRVASAVGGEVGPLPAPRLVTYPEATDRCVPRIVASAGSGAWVSERTVPRRVALVGLVGEVGPLPPTRPTAAAPAYPEATDRCVPRMVASAYTVDDVCAMPAVCWTGERAVPRSVALVGDVAPLPPTPRLVAYPEAGIADVCARLAV